MKGLKVFLSGAIICLSVFSIPFTASASVVRQVEPISLYSEEGITLRADVIVIKTRVNNGVHQYRRWNETWGYWVDPYWINF